MPQAAKPLRHWLLDAEAGRDPRLHAADDDLPLDRLGAGTGLGPLRGALAGRSVLVLTGTQRAAAVALVELDGLARRLVLAPPDLKISDLPAVMAGAEIDALLCDGDPPDVGPGTLLAVPGPLAPLPDAAAREADRDTEWVLLTSGTTGLPKMVIHSRIGLAGAIDPAAQAPVWGTFYDIRRYGGLQILLRALIGGGSMVLSQAGEPLPDHLNRLAAAGVTHLSGTPSHWRRALMTPEIARIAPRVVRLSGEIADQAVLDSLRRAFPKAAIGHAYASTEAGVGFEVTDGREGFPAAYLGVAGPVAMKVEDGSLRIRSARTASRYIGAAPRPLADRDGFVDTDDLVERRGDRMHFVGRRSGIINVGGLKVHPEEVEAVINRHAAVRMSLVKGRANPITGAVVVADVVPERSLAGAGVQAGLKAEILDLCRAALPAHKVPVLLRFAEALAVTPAGKLARHDA